MTPVVTYIKGDLEVKLCRLIIFTPSRELFLYPIFDQVYAITRLIDRIAYNTSLRIAFDLRLAFDHAIPEQLDLLPGILRKIIQGSRGYPKLRCRHL